MIKSVQVDTNSVCGSRCYFCPVRYYKRPHISVMNNLLFRDILSQLKTGVQEGVVDPSYAIWLSSYNDVLHDIYLEERLLSLREYSKQFYLLTNGIMIESKLNLISEFKDVISGISVNLSAGNAVDYERFTGNSKDIFYQIINGLVSLYSKDPEWYSRITSVSVNGVYDDPIGRSQMRFDLPIGDTDKQVDQLKRILPFRVCDARPLCDRAGLLRKVSIIDNQAGEVRPMWRLPVGSEKATGCNGGSRLDEWIHIASDGNLYICCQDFHEEYSYGNANTDKILEAFLSEKRLVVKEEALKSLCTRCWFSY